jgi:hypothetical protein
MNIQKLTLTLDLSLSRRLAEQGMADIEPDDPAWQDREMGLISRMGSAMTKYTGWGNFFVYLSSPWDEGDIVSGQIGDREGAIEKMVMGEEYRPYRNGKDDRRHNWNGYYCENLEECEECDE